MEGMENVLKRECVLEKEEQEEKGRKMQKEEDEEETSKEDKIVHKVFELNCRRRNKKNITKILWIYIIATMFKFSFIL